ncbi:helix-turn-helix transcriptional regulator [Geobacter pickeringii]|nr:WYL domain-containing protein [Geobacter pickeringii]
MLKREKDSWARQLVDMIETVKLLSRPQGASINEIVENTSVERRTVFRLFKTLEKNGLPVHEVATGIIERQKRYQLEEGAVLKTPNMAALNYDEILSLYALRGNMGIYSGTMIEESIDSAFRKLGLILPAGIRKAMERYATLFIPTVKAAKDYSAMQETIDELHYAMLNSKICTITYHSFHDDTEKTFNIHPLHFFERDGGLYLFAVAARFGNVRTLAVERILSLEIAEQEFTYPEDFNPRELLDSAFNIIFDDPIAVTVRFSADKVRYIKERRWASEQTITDEPDGSVILEMKTSGWGEVKRWLLSFGPVVEVLEPVKLREEVREELRAALGVYG